MGALGDCWVMGKGPWAELLLPHWLLWLSHAGAGLAVPAVRVAHAWHSSCISGPGPPEPEIPLVKGGAERSRDVFTAASLAGGALSQQSQAALCPQLRWERCGHGVKRTHERLRKVDGLLRDGVFVSSAALTQKPKLLHKYMAS